MTIHTPITRELLEFLLPHLRELDRIETHSNRNNPTGCRHAQVCINNIRNALGEMAV